MMKYVLCCMTAATLGPLTLHGQATSTASRRFDLQAGGEFVYGSSDYYPQKFKGAGVYATLDFTKHLGAEIDFRQADSPVDAGYERTYEAGVRYHRNYGRFVPYVKGMYGRGVFNFIYDNQVIANLAYNEAVIGAGTDYRLLPWLNLRADYEYQRWFKFSSTGLSPQMVSVGVAYHFPGGLQKGRRFR